MADDMSLLCSAFIIHQMNVDRPDLVIASGNYAWEIHRHLVSRSSQKTFVRGQTSLGAHHSWMMARLIQFLYTHDYDVKYSKFSGARSTFDFTLENVLSGRKREADQDHNFIEDKARDQTQTELEIHLKMAELAYMHAMPTLVEHALSRAFKCNYGKDTSVQDLLKKASSIMGITNITRDDQLRRLFAGFIADNKDKIDESTLRNWLRGDGTFAIEVVDCLDSRSRGLEGQVAVVEEPRNLKKRRLSIELLGSEASRGCESV